MALKTHLPYLRALILLLTLTSLFANQDIDDISLESLLDVTISTAAKYDQKVSNVAASVYIITSDEIEAHGYTTIDEVLNTLPGYYSSYDRNYTYSGSRGFSRPSDYNNRIVILLDGHKLNDGFYGSVDTGSQLSTINLRSLQRIEIIQGPGSVLYGTGALFAVINLISKTNQDINNLNIAVEAGGFGVQRGMASYGKSLNNDLKLVISGLVGQTTGQDLYYSEYDAPETNHGIAEGLDGDEQLGFNVLIQYKRLKLSSMMTQQKKSIPTAAWESAFNTAGSKTMDRTSFIELKYDHPLNSAQNLSFRSYLDHYNYQGELAYEDVDEDGVPYIYPWQDENRVMSLGFEGSLQWDTHSNNRLFTGLELQDHRVARYKEWDPWAIGYSGDHPYNLVSAYIQDEYQIEKNLSLTSGLRYDKYSNSSGFLTPRVAMVYSPSLSKTFKILHGSAFRMPSLYERYYHDRIYGYKSNPSLKNEQIISTEINWLETITNRTHFSLAVYHYLINGLIDQVVDPADGLIIHKNVNKVTSNGLEWKLKRVYSDNNNGYISYSFQRTIDESTGKKLSNSPSHLFKTGSNFLLLKRIGLGFDLRYESPRKTVRNTKTESYFLADLNLHSGFLDDRFTLSIKVRNLFDSDYSHPAGWEHLQSSIQQDGRSMIFRAEYSISSSR